MERGGKRGGKRVTKTASTRAEDEARALEQVLALYERLYTKVGLPRRVAGALWRRTIAWVRAGRRGRRPMLTREQLRIALRVREEQEAAFKDAIDALGANLRILGYGRSSVPSAVEADEQQINRQACTFPVQGVDHVVYLVGPTGNDRGDRERNALWLEPRFEPLPQIAPVLLTPAFDLIEYLTFNVSAVVRIDRDDGEHWKLPGTKAHLVHALNAVAYALNRGEAFFQTEGIRWNDDLIEIKAPFIEAPDWGGDGTITIATSVIGEGEYRIDLFGGIMVPPDDRQHDVRARLTSTLDAIGALPLDEVTFDFTTPPDLGLTPRPHALSEALYRSSFPLVSVEPMSARACIGDGVELAASVIQSPSGTLRLLLRFVRMSPSRDLWSAIRDFDTASLLEEAGLGAG